MTDLIDRFRSALADRYTFREELGRGGMAMVFLADDLKHGRQVAVKVFQPEFAATLGAERFLREIETAARLNHPHILAVHDSGEADGFLYYVMPYMEGDSLRDRLDREGQLPVDEAVRITREVAGGLDFAHQNGVVHRDIKPGNIMFSGGHAVVADFGITRAISEAESERLTETGLAIGTPSYMSPEQSTGGEEVDARSDTYSLACVLYEMLAGEPPYTGPTAAAIIAKRLSDTVPSVRVVRETVPEALDRALTRALAKTPADRYTSVAGFADAVDNAVSEPDPVAQPRRFLLRRAAVGAVAVVAVLAVFAISMMLRRGAGERDSNPAAGLDGRVPIAVLPFQATGPDAEFWHESIVDMLSDNLEGVEGLRSVDPRAVLSAWSRKIGEGLDAPDTGTALDIARQVGAGYAVSGSAARLGENLRLSAEVYDVEQARRRGAPVDVVGSADSVFSLVNRLTVELLRSGELATGEDELLSVDLSQVTTTSLPALKAYLAGHRKYRLSRFTEAAQDFQRAVELDSTFGRAWYRLAGARGWTGDGAGSGAAARRAAEFADQLSERDSLFLTAGATFSPSEIPALEELTRRYPDDVEAWITLGERYFHSGGPALYPADAYAAALERAVELDPFWGETYVHLIENAFVRLDSANAAKLIAAYRSTDPESGLCPAAGIAHDLIWGSSELQTRASERLDSLTSLSEPEEFSCPQVPLLLPARAIAEIELVRRVALDPQYPEEERMPMLWRMLQARLPLGQYEAGRRLLTEAATLPGTRIDAARWEIMLHASGFPDSVRARRAADRLAEQPEYLDHFWIGALAVHEARWDDFEGAARAIDAMATDRLSSATTARDSGQARLWKEYARALRAYAALRGGEERQLFEFEAALRELPAVGWRREEPEKFLRYQVGRLLVDQGRFEEAKPYFESFQHFHWPYSTLALFYLGRIHEEMGDTEEALAYYDLFGRWWEYADPELQTWREEAWQALARLAREPA